MKKIQLIILIYFSFLAGDIGHLNSIFEGVAGEIPVRVIVKTSGVVPGLADINIRVFSDKVHQVTARPIYWHAGEKGAPPADIAHPVKGENNLYSTQLWLMNFGSYNVQVKIYSGEEIFEVNVPVNSLALEIKEMESSLVIILWLFMLLLIFGAVNIITISYRESTIHPDDSPSLDRIRKAKFVMAISFVLVIGILYSGYNWWDDVEKLYANNLFQSLQTEVKIVIINNQNILKVTITDPAIVEGRMPDIIPDHGKIIHMYLVKDDLSVLSHIHPSRSIKNKYVFEVLMPPVPKGNYSVYMDITYESGLTETVLTPIEYKSPIELMEIGKVPIRDPDDSWTHDKMQHKIIWLNKKNEYLQEEEIKLEFQAFNFKKVPTKLEPYIQMGGHGALISPDNNVFIHFHPIGTISMASQQIFDKQQELATNEKSGICYYGLPIDTAKTYSEGLQSNIGRVSFPPLSLDKAGDYYMWVQVKTEGEVVTEKFSFTVMN